MRLATENMVIIVIMPVDRNDAEMIQPFRNIGITSTAGALKEYYNEYSVYTDSYGQSQRCLQASFTTGALASNGVIYRHP